MTQLTLRTPDNQPVTVTVDRLIIAGWAGRDADGVAHHIKELQALGVTPPATVPCFYPLSASLLTTDDVIEVPRSDSSGEVEVVLLSTADGVLVALGSDHTDRKAEAYDVTVSKQMCAKPISTEVWRYDDLVGHWDELVARCWRTRDGQRALYQEGALASLLDPRDLIRKLTGGDTLPVGTAMFCGTQPVQGELGFGDRFEFELFDPRSNRSLKFAYDLHSLPVA